VEYQTERSTRGFVHEVECDEKDCCPPLKVFAPRNGAMSREEIERDVSTFPLGSGTNFISPADTGFRDLKRNGAIPRDYLSARR